METTEIYTYLYALSQHGALPIWRLVAARHVAAAARRPVALQRRARGTLSAARTGRRRIADAGRHWPASARLGARARLARPAAARNSKRQRPGSGDRTSRTHPARTLYPHRGAAMIRSEEHTSELQSIMRNS